MTDALPVQLVERLPSGQLVTSDERARREIETAVAGFLAGYRVPSTRANYARALDQFLSYCQQAFVDPFHVTRAHVNLWARKLEELDGLSQSSVAGRLIALSGFYKMLHADGLVDRNPMEGVTRPQIERVSTREGLTRTEFADLDKLARLSGPRDWALVRLLGINGLRVSEALGIDIGHLKRNEGETVVSVTRKYGRVAVLPLEARTAWAIEQTIDDRYSGPLFLARTGNRMDRASAGRVIKRLARAAGIRKHITPHSLRHTAVTMARAAGVPDDEIMASTGHRDPRMCDYYDRTSKVTKARSAVTAIASFVDRAT